MINAFEKVDLETVKTLKDLIKDKNIQNEDKINSVKKIFNQLSIRELTENKIKDLHRNAMRSMNKVSCETDKKNILLNFADQIMTRNK